jgi:hypothetical protein
MVFEILLFYKKKTGCISAACPIQEYPFCYFLMAVAVAVTAGRVIAASGSGKS